MSTECAHDWFLVATVDGEPVRSCTHCGELSSPKVVNISHLVDTRQWWKGFGVYSEQDELLGRLRMRWEDGQDPGIPEKLQRLL